VPEEAETIRTIFSLYLELGSLGALIAELDQRASRPRSTAAVMGKRAAVFTFGVGPLAHLLKNRFYIGEVTYRGQVHHGEQRSLSLDELRDQWRAAFRASQPPAFTKDLARFLCWHIQEQAVGGLENRQTSHKFARGDRSPADRPRRLQPGTVLVREYQSKARYRSYQR
jgi:hypothetical protein